MVFNKRKNLILLVDLLIFFSVYCVGVILISIVDGFCFDFAVYCAYFLLCIIVLFFIRSIFKIYSNVWRYADSSIYARTVFADAIGGSIVTFVSTFIFTKWINIGFWQGLLFIAVSDIATLFSRFVYRILYKRSHVIDGKISNKIRVAIVGAGQVGTLLAEELLYNNSSRYIPVCFIDKDENKIGNKIFDLDVYSEKKSPDCLENLDILEVFIAIPDMNADDMLVLRDKYSNAGYNVKIYDFPIKDGDSTKSKRVIREIKIEDLLFRNTIQVVDDATRTYFAKKTVLVTGGGGSIGSELCRQIADCKPKKLIIFDVYENNAYELQQELVRKHSDSLDLIVEIGSVRDRSRLEAVFKAYKPHIVIHAAAHKHVPLMEHSNAEAIKNNVFGTYNTADFAEKYKTEKFILISTDKAVNPTNIMGASKRLCEMIVQSRYDSETVFCAVRFGNVLGSNGSVIPLFKRQIEAGGPVTITDKRIIRYFMTIPEASGLVMQAGAMARRGELFVLDMGKPVKIIDLAENMIRLSGFEPYKDIDIIEIGLRPGEKLYEELLIKSEDMQKTDNNLIFIEQDSALTRAEIDKKMKYLQEVVSQAQLNIADASINQAMKNVVPTFNNPELINANANQCDEMCVVNAL